MPRTRLSELCRPAAEKRLRDVIIARDGTPRGGVWSAVTVDQPARAGSVRLAGEIELGADFDELPPRVRRLHGVSGVSSSTRHIALLGLSAIRRAAERCGEGPASSTHRSTVRLSPISVWEAAIKRQAGRLRAPT